MRLFWLIAGCLSLGAGVIGVVLPLLPTVPFILLAAFCFARSSERLHNWLITHRHFGAMIQDWHARGAISQRAKILATLSIAAVFGLSLAMQLKPSVITIQAVTLSLVLVFIWTRPD